MTATPESPSDKALEGRPHGPLMRIGEVAQQTGLPIQTIRFYCDQGLLEFITRSEGGFRLFDQRVFEDLDLIRSLKHLDTPLKQICELLQSRRSGICHCNEVKVSLSHKVQSLDNKIKELQEMRINLQTVIESWQNCGGIRQESIAD